MTKLLAKAFSEAAKLPESQQEALAAWILEELAAERRWDESFAASGDALAQLSEEALAEHRDGKTEELDPEAM